jgi:hypothetical protein
VSLNEVVVVGNRNKAFEFKVLRKRRRLENEATAPALEPLPVMHVENEKQYEIKAICHPSLGIDKTAERTS